VAVFSDVTDEEGNRRLRRNSILGLTLLITDRGPPLRIKIIRIGPSVSNNHIHLDLMSD